MTDTTVPPDVFHVRLAGRLGEISGLILANRLPMPKASRPPSLDFDLGSDADKIVEVALALGVEIQHYGPRVQVSWPPIHERGDGLPFATWHATVPSDAGHGFSREADDPTPVSGARIEPHTGDVVSHIDESGRREDDVTPVPVGERDLVDETEREVRCASSDPHEPHRTTFAPEMGIENGRCPGVAAKRAVGETRGAQAETYFRPGDRVVRRGGMPRGFPETLRVIEVRPVEGTGETTPQRWQFLSAERRGSGWWLHCDEYVRVSEREALASAETWKDPA